MSRFGHVIGMVLQITVMGVAAVLGAVSACLGWWVALVVFQYEGF